MQIEGVLLMIRTYESRDTDTLVSMIQKDKHMSAKEIVERLTENTAFVFDDGTLKGCAVVTPVKNSAYGNRSDLWLYTSPEYRRQGVGAALYTEVEKHLAQNPTEALITGFRSDKGDSTAFFARRGFPYWFSSHLMSYDGPDFANVTIELLPYDESHFDSVVSIINEGFAELRQTNNIIPIECYPAGFDRSATQAKFRSDKDNTFLVFSDSELVGYLLVEDCYIETIAVNQKYRRQGIGRQLTQAGVNLLRQRGVSTVYLGVVDTNKGARALYESLGFKLVETHAFAKKIKSNS